uniref:Odorant-binding protein n=1 Tax=Anoplophora chinensis TaxID=217632 RepID=A0A2H4ZB11_ANOCN|nr:odorant-binding protein [Anoplophora chinensis]
MLTSSESSLFTEALSYSYSCVLRIILLDGTFVYSFVQLGLI